MRTHAEFALLLTLALGRLHLVPFKFQCGVGVLLAGVTVGQIGNRYGTILSPQQAGWHQLSGTGDRE